MAIRRHTDILGGIVGGLPPLVPFAGWRVYNVTDVYTDPEGLEYPVFRIVKASGPTPDTIAQITARTSSYYVEKKWTIGGGALAGQYPGLAWYLMDPTTLATVAGPLLPVGNQTLLRDWNPEMAAKTPLTQHVLQWFEHSTPTGPFVAVLVAREPTSDLPLFVSGHPVDIATDLLTEKGEAYDAASALSCRNALGPELGVTLPISTGTESPQDVINRFSEGFGFTLRHGESGSVEFVHWREKLGDISALPVLDINSIRAEGGPTFDLSDGTRINRVKVSGQVLSKWTPGQVKEAKVKPKLFLGFIPYGIKTEWTTRTDLLATDKPASGLVISSGDITFDYSTDGTTPDADVYGAQEMEIDLGGMPGFIGSGGVVYPTNLEQFAEGVARLTLDGHARGRVLMTVPVIRGKQAASSQLGDAVTVTVGHVPNAQLGRTPTSQRMATDDGQRPFRVIERTEEMSGPVLTLVDEGTGVQFATVPSLVVWTDPYEADLLLVSVSDAATLAAAGAQVEFQVRVFAFGDPIDLTDPGVSYTVRDSTLWTDDPQVVRLGPFPLFHTVLLRVRTWLYGGAASDWSPWTGLGGEITGAGTTLSNLVVNGTTDEGAVISWSYDESPQVGSVLVQYRLHGGGGYTLFSTLPPGTETETLTGLTADTWYDVRVVLDNGGEYGDVLLGSFTTMVGAISALVVGTPTSDGVAISWTNTHPTAYVRVQYKLDTATDYQLYQLLPAGSVQLTLTGLTAGTAYDVRVQLVDLTVGTEIGAPLDGSFTTAASGSMVTLTTPTNPQGFGGVDPVSGLNSPGTFGLEVTAVFGPPHMQIVYEVAVETAVGSNTAGSYTAQAPVPAVVGSPTRYTATAPNDNLKRYLRAKATATGFTDSAYTAVVAVDPWPAVPVSGGNATASTGVGVLRLFGYAPEVSTGGGGGSYTDEQAQDAVGTILVDSSTINFTYTDATPEITAIVIDDSITFDKVQNIATSRILGRDTAGSGNIEELTASEVLALLGGAPAPGTGLPYMYPNTDAIDDPVNDNFSLDAALDTTGSRFSGASSWSWVNQGAATATIVRKRMELTSPASGGTNIRAIVQPVPSGNWRIRCNVNFRGNPATSTHVGMVLRESGTGKLITWNLGFSGGYLAWVTKWTNPTTFSATYTTAGIDNERQFPQFLEIEYDGTNYYWRYSMHDISYFAVHSAAKADFFTTAADEIGLFSNNDTSAAITGIFRDFYRVE